MQLQHFMCACACACGDGILYLTSIDNRSHSIHCILLTASRGFPVLALPIFYHPYPWLHVWGYYEMAWNLDPIFRVKNYVQLKLRDTIDSFQNAVSAIVPNIKSLANICMIERPIRTTNDMEINSKQVVRIAIRQSILYCNIILRKHKRYTRYCIHTHVVYTQTHKFKQTYREKKTDTQLWAQRKSLASFKYGNNSTIIRYFLCHLMTKMMLIFGIGCKAFALNAFISND